MRGERSNPQVGEFEYLFRLFETYTWVQVQADTVYLQRTGVITVTEGLLFLAFQAVSDLGGRYGQSLTIGIASIGLVLSALWLFFEQRNEMYFRGRGQVLLELEAELAGRCRTAGVAFKSFWTEVPQWVRLNAPWYRRLSAPLVLRALVPGLFIVGWLFMLTASATLFGRVQNTSDASANTPARISTSVSDLQVTPDP